MTDENIQEVQAEEEPQGESKSKTDWKAEARKWEALAKKGKAAEDELEQMKQAQMTEQEKLSQRAEKAEAELAEMKAEAARLQSAREIASKQSVPVELLEFCADADAMEAFCKVYRDVQPQVHAAAGAVPMRINRDGVKLDPKDAFVAFAEKEFN